MYYLSHVPKSWALMMLVSASISLFLQGNGMSMLHNSNKNYATHFLEVIFQETETGDVLLCFFVFWFFF